MTAVNGLSLNDVISKPAWADLTRSTNTSPVLLAHPASVIETASANQAETFADEYKNYFIFDINNILRILFTRQVRKLLGLQLVAGRVC